MLRLRCFYFFAGAFLVASLCFSCASSGAVVSPEECFNLGQAYFDLGKYAEAEPWYRKAAQEKSTRNAALYQLGRVTFSLGRVQEAAVIFEDLLKKDPDNVTILRAAAYARVTAGDAEKAKALYERIAKRVPDSAAERYNYALVLYSLKEYDKALELLKAEVASATSDDRNLQLLLARTHRALGHPEAVDLYTAWLTKGDDQKVRLELAGLCFDLQLYAKSVESYDALLTAGAADKLGLAKGELRFLKARAMIWGGDGNGGPELEKAVTDGYADDKAIAELRKKAALLPPPATPDPGKAAATGAAAPPAAASPAAAAASATTPATAGTSK